MYGEREVHACMTMKFMCMSMRFMCSVVSAMVARTSALVDQGGCMWYPSDNTWEAPKSGSLVERLIPRFYVGRMRKFLQNTDCFVPRGAFSFAGLIIGEVYVRAFTVCDFRSRKQVSHNQISSPVKPWEWP